MSRQPILGPCAWHGDDLSRTRSWIHRLSPRELGELDEALVGLREGGLAGEEVVKDNFPLPTLGERLRAIGEELEEGCGLAKITGLPVDAYGGQDLRAIWFGMGSHFGTPVYQDPHGQLMRAIRDEGPDVGARHGEWKTDDQGGTFLSSKARAQSNRLLRFHTDRCDVVGLLCVRAARSGGVSRLASSVAVCNAMLERRPDLVELLFQPYYRSRFGEEAGCERDAYALPVFGARGGKFTSHYSRTYIEAAQLLPNIPKMSHAQWEAMDLLHQVAEELCMEMVLKPGDMQFLNNHVIYHARTAFEDDRRAGHGRQLYRLWLCVPNHRALPEGHQVLWGNIEAGQPRGGIRPQAVS